MASKNTEEKTEEQVNKEPTMEVKDLCCSAKYKERTHQIEVDGETHIYVMTFNKYTPMPYAHACQFAQHTGFEVKDAEGKIFKPVRELRDAAGMITAQLEPDEVVANLEELSNDALALRANALGGNYSRTHKKDVIVQFITDCNKKRRAKGPDEEEILVG